MGPDQTTVQTSFKQPLSTMTHVRTQDEALDAHLRHLEHQEYREYISEFSKSNLHSNLAAKPPSTSMRDAVTGFATHPNGPEEEQNTIDEFEDI